MSTDQQQKNNEEEVDLGSLFIIIGRGFSKFFAFIGSIFKGIFEFVITILLFLKEHFKKIAIAAILGGVLGLFIETTKNDLYGSEMLVEPNFESAKQLYNNVNYYNDLVKQKDTLVLANTFKISNKEAASLKKFTIEPIVNQNDIIKGYNSFVLSVDTTTVKSYTFQEFKNAFTNLDYKLHKITVLSEENSVFTKLDDVIISSVTTNQYFKRLKELTNENLNRTDSVYRKNLSQLDSLRKVYMQVMIEEAKKLSTGTSIDLGGEKKSTKELELFETNKKINNDLRALANEKSKNYEVINVISNFQPVGYKIKGVTNNYVFLLGVISVGFMIVILLLIKLNIYLDNYKK